MVTPAAKRNAVAHLMDHHQMSERRACKAIGVCRMTIRYETRRSDDHDLRERMKALAHDAAALDIDAFMYCSGVRVTL